MFWQHQESQHGPGKLSYHLAGHSHIGSWATVKFKVAIWHYARPNKSNLAFLIALGPEIFGLAFWHFLAFWASLALKTFTWPWCYFLPLFWLFLHEVKFGISTTVEVTEWAPAPIFCYHMLTIGLIVTYSAASACAQWCNVTVVSVVNAILCILYKRKSDKKSQTFVCDCWCSQLVSIWLTSMYLV